MAMPPLCLDITDPDIRITAVPLERAAFAEFGEVIENPQPKIHPSALSPSSDPALPPLPFDAVLANQGSAIKYQHVAHLTNLCDQAPSGRIGAAVANLFSCAALGRRDGEGQARGRGEGGSTRTGSRLTIPIKVLERHPFTSQTFSPLSTDENAEYLVVVAPSLPPSSMDEGLPTPNGYYRGKLLPGRGLPDLRRLSAFVSRPSQAITYGPGTWHAPMIALGREGTAMDFFVVQFTTGVGIEDCQEVVLRSSANTRAPMSPEAKQILVDVSDPLVMARL